MNHSCNPNVIVTYKGTVAEVRAVQEINPGDEVSPLWKQRCFSVLWHCHIYEGTHTLVFLRLPLL